MAQGDHRSARRRSAKWRSLANYVSQAIPTLAIPAASLAILTSGHGLRAETVGLYILAIVVGLAIFWALASVYPRAYVRKGRWGFSPLVVEGILFNAAAAAAAYALGP